LEKYAKRYTILQSSEESCRHHYENVGFGSFGSVYASNLSGSEKFAIKCLKFKENDIEELKNHIREFFIADLMSATGIGPRILRKNGFDFIVFPTCLEFDMEMGSSVELSTLEEDLKQNLLKMHALNVVHSDIKPSNVIYSNL
jgi:serine/threonine protein kinase